MLRVLEKVNSIKLKSISLFKTILFIVIGLYFQNIFIYVFLAILLFIDNYKYVFIYSFLLLIILFLNNHKTDFIKVGIVDYKLNNNYVIYKGLYRTHIKDDELIEVGDIIITYDYSSLDKISSIKKNILFQNNNYKKVLNFKLRKYLYNNINNDNSNNSSILNSLIYNIHDYDSDISSLTIGLTSYYLLNTIRKRTNKYCLISMFIYSLLFVFEFKFIFIIIDIICDKYKTDRYISIFFKILIILLLNYRMFNNYSILLPLLFSFYSIFDFKFDFRIYLFLIQSILFGEINLIYTFLFSFIQNFKIVLLCMSILVTLSNISINSIQLNNYLSIFNILNLSIRGQISIISLIVFLFINNTKIHNIFKYCILICLILSPLNNPYRHITFIDVGQGDSAMIKNPLNHSCILIDTGSKYNYYKLKKFLFKEGIYKIDKLIITHNDSDHNGNIDNLLKDFDIVEIINKGRDIEYKDLKLKYYDLGIYDNDNDNSLVYSLYIDGLNFLFTGDISIEAERELLNRYSPLDIDVLKVSHHGSNTSSSEYFINMLLPEYGIISSSGQYNHPHFEVVDRLNRYMVNIYNTKDSKDISFYFTTFFKYLKTGSGEFVIIRE